MTYKNALGIAFPNKTIFSLNWLVYDELSIHSFYTDSNLTWLAEYKAYFNQFMDDIKLGMIFQNYPNAILWVNNLHIDILKTYTINNQTECVILTFWIREFQRQCKLKLLKHKCFRNIKNIFLRQQTGKFIQ